MCGKGGGGGGGVGGRLSLSFYVVAVCSETAIVHVDLRHCLIFLTVIVSHSVTGKPTGNFLFPPQYLVVDVAVAC